MLALLKSDEQLAQFEALMALTNLCSLGYEVREAVVAQDGLTQIELLQMSDHVMVKRSATECVHNLVPCSEVFERFKDGEGELIDWWVALAEDDADFATARAACGMMAMITRDPECCELIGRRKLLPRLVDVVREWDDDAITQRIVVALENFVEQCRPLGSGLAQLKAAGAKALLEDVEAEDEAVLQALVDLKGLL
jgi:urease gamma subunit